MKKHYRNPSVGGRRRRARLPSTCSDAGDGAAQLRASPLARATVQAFQRSRAHLDAPAHTMRHRAATIIQRVYRLYVAGGRSGLHGEMATRSKIAQIRSALRELQAEEAAVRAGKLAMTVNQLKDRYRGCNSLGGAGVLRAAVMLKGVVEGRSRLVQPTPPMPRHVTDAALALAMGRHHRLGRRSPVYVLPVTLLRLIMSFLGMSSIVDEQMTWHVTPQGRPQLRFCGIMWEALPSSTQKQAWEQRVRELEKEDGIDAVLRRRRLAARRGSFRRDAPSVAPMPAFGETDAEEVLQVIDDDARSLSEGSESTGAGTHVCWFPLQEIRKFGLHVSGIASHGNAWRSDYGIPLPLDKLVQSGDTPLHVASRCGHLSVCRLLIAHGSALLRNASDRTPDEVFDAQPCLPNPFIDVPLRGRQPERGEQLFYVGRKADVRAHDDATAAHLDVLNEPVRASGEVVDVLLCLSKRPDSDRRRRRRGSAGRLARSTAPVVQSAPPSRPGGSPVTRAAYVRGGVRATSGRSSNVSRVVGELPRSRTARGTQEDARGEPTHEFYLLPPDAYEVADGVVSPAHGGAGGADARVDASALELMKVPTGARKQRDTCWEVRLYEVAKPHAQWSEAWLVDSRQVSVKRDVLHVVQRVEVSPPLPVRPGQFVGLANTAGRMMLAAPPPHAGSVPRWHLDTTAFLGHTILSRVEQQAAWCAVVRVRPGDTLPSSPILSDLSRQRQRATAGSLRNATRRLRRAASTGAAPPTPVQTGATGDSDSVKEAHRRLLTDLEDLAARVARGEQISLAEISTGGAQEPRVEAWSERDEVPLGIGAVSPIKTTGDALPIPAANGEERPADIDVDVIAKTRRRKSQRAGEVNLNLEASRRQARRAFRHHAPVLPTAGAAPPLYGSKVSATFGSAIYGAGTRMRDFGKQPFRKPKIWRS